MNTLNALLTSTMSLKAQSPLFRLGVQLVVQQIEVMEFGLKFLLGTPGPHLFLQWIIHCQ